MWLSVRQRLTLVDSVAHMVAGDDITEVREDGGSDGFWLVVNGNNGGDDGLVVRTEMVMSVVVTYVVTMISGGDGGNGDMGFEEV
nr:hypothetical protein [Tanacetum cinerariifolium]